MEAVLEFQHHGMRDLSFHSSKIQVKDFWVIVLYNATGGHKCFQEPLPPPFLG